MIGNCELYGKKGQSLDHAGHARPAHRRGQPAGPGWFERRHAGHHQGRLRVLHGRQHRPPPRAGQGRSVVNVAWDALVAGQTKNYDLALSQASITDERKKVVDFSVPYFYSDIGVLVKKGTKVDERVDQVRRASACSRRPPAPTSSSQTLKPDDSRSRSSPTRPRCSPRCWRARSTSRMTDTAIVLGQAAESQAAGSRWSASTPPARATARIYPKGSPNAARSTR